jgi:ABC-type multidrug transport system fused ATPase/permease subunit
VRSSPLLRSDQLNTTSPARFLLSLARLQRSRILAATIYSTAWLVSQALIPAVIGRTIDTGIARHDTRELVFWCLVVLALGIIRAASSISGYRLILIIRAMNGYHTTQVVTRQATVLGAALPELMAGGEVTAIGTSDIGAVGAAVTQFGRLVGSIVTIATVALIMLTTSIPLGLLVLLGVPVMTGLSSLLLRSLQKRQDEYRDIEGVLTGRAVDIAGGLRVLRGIGGERMFAANYRVESAKLRDADVAVSRVEADLYGLQVLIPGILTAVVTFVAARYALDTRLTVGQLVAFYGYAAFLSLPLALLLDGFQAFPRSLVGAGRVIRLLNLQPRIQDAPGTAGDSLSDPVSDPGDGPGDLVDTISGLTAPAGSFVAVACADPGDAVTLSRRLTRFDESRGPALGGHPLASIPLRVVRSRILLATNGDRLFSGTLRSELDPSGTASAGDLEAALNAACAYDFISELPDGLETTIADNGRAFSGGQLQRLRLARALLKKSEITVLVEPTNAVDAHTELLIARNLAGRHETGDADVHPADAPGSLQTTVIFTVSPLLLDRAQSVAFVVDGTVAASGPHHELLSRVPAYRTVVTRDVDVEVKA